jgi:hypothetical protein
MTFPLFRTLSIAMLCLAGSAMPLQSQAASNDEPYALVRDGQRTTFVGSHRSDDSAVDALKKVYPGNFIWFRESGKGYVVRDPATLSKVAAAWAPADKLGLEMNQFDVQMRAESEKMNGLGREMTSAVRGPKAERGAAEAIGKRMDAQGKTMDALGKQMGALGKQIERESKLADASTRTLLRAAVTSGTAQNVAENIR